MAGNKLEATEGTLVDALFSEAMCEVGLVVKAPLPIFIRILLASFGDDTIEDLGKFVSLQIV